MSDIIPPLRLPHSQKPVSNRLNAPIHAERHVKVICIGAGASGLLMAYKMQKHFRNFSLNVYEKNQDIAGTWFENRYPG
jgi:cation diffusion facilitator CzcD-associated flavoprotein CzcO